MYFCPDPITIDKSEDWGKGNVQRHKNGAWVQIKNDVISHLVAESVNNTPVGWVQIKPNSFVKKPVFAKQTSLSVVDLQTLDGPMKMDNSTRDGWILFNQNDKGEPDLNDSWFMTNDEFKQVYILDD